MRKGVPFALSLPALELIFFWYGLLCILYNILGVMKTQLRPLKSISFLSVKMDYFLRFKYTDFLSVHLRLSSYWTVPGAPLVPHP